MATKSSSKSSQASVSDRENAVTQFQEEQDRQARETAIAVNATRDAIKATNQYQHGATTREEQILLEASTQGKRFSGDFREQIPETSSEVRVHNQWNDEVAAELEEEYGSGAVDAETEGEAEPVHELAAARGNDVPEDAQPKRQQSSSPTSKQRSARTGPTGPTGATGTTKK